jgi:hypothetical protein
MFPFPFPIDHAPKAALLILYQTVAVTENVLIAEDVVYLHRYNKLVLMIDEAYPAVFALDRRQSLREMPRALILAFYHDLTCIGIKEAAPAFLVTEDGQRITLGHGRDPPEPRRHPLVIDIVICIAGTVGKALDLYMFTQVILIGVNLTETPTYLPLDFTIYKTKGREDKEKKSSSPRETVKFYK